MTNELLIALHSSAATSWLFLAAHQYGRSRWRFLMSLAFCLMFSGFVVARVVGWFR